MNPRPPSNNNRDVMRYAGLATQLLVATGLAVFAGIELDRWLHLSPVCTCVLPLLALAAIFYKLMKDTSKPPEK